MNALVLWLIHADKMVYGHFSLRMLLYRLMAVGLLVLISKRAHNYLERLRGYVAAWSFDGFQSKNYFQLLFVAVLCHFYRLGNFLLSIDDEWAAIRTDPIPWVVQGRWAVYWVERVLITHPAVPTFPDMLYCIAMTAAYLLVLKSHRIIVGPFAYTLFPIFCAFPSLSVLGEFYANVPTLGLGFLLCGLAASLSADHTLEGKKPRLWSSLVAQSACIATAVACYQPFILVFVAFALGALFCRAASDQATGLAALVAGQVRIAVQTVAGFALYLLVQRLHLWALGVDEGYTAILMRPDRIWADLSGLLKQVLGQMTQAFGGAQSLYGIELPTLKWTMFLGLAGLLAALRAWSSLRSFAGVMLMALQVVCLPFAFLLLSGGYLPLRTFLALPYVVWLFALFAANQRALLLRAIAVVCVTGCSFQIIYLNSIYAAQMAVTQQHDRNLAADIYGRLQATHDGFSLAKNYKVDLFGMPAVPEPIFPTAHSSTTSASFFNWDFGNPWRMVNFMNLLGYSNIAVVGFDEREALTPLFAEMPIWPAVGSVKWHNDIALVKLGPLAGVFHAPFMAPR